MSRRRRVIALLAVAMLVAACSSGLRLPSTAASSSIAAVPASSLTPTTTPSAPPKPVASPSPEQAEAQRLVDRLLSDHFGQATAAAYAVTTVAIFLRSLPDTAGAPSNRAPNDEVIVVEVDGTFNPPVSCYSSATCTEDSSLEAYDMTRGIELWSAWGSGSIGGPRLRWVRSFGTPIPLSIAG